MAEISHETTRQIGVLLDRKGRVEYVMVGDARSIDMPDFGRSRASSGRFRGLRCVHTHLLGEKLTHDDLTDLALLRLDLMTAIEVKRSDGLPGLVYSAHLLPGSDDERPSDGNGDAGSFEFLEPRIASQLDTDFSALITSLESEMARLKRPAKVRGATREQVILVSVTTGPADDAAESLSELEELALSANVDVVDKVLQRRPQIDPRTVLGRGKLDELLIRSMRLGADMLVFDTELTPAQVRSLSEATDLKVIDRSQLILDIFAQRAQSREGKLQVELAQLKYLLPRLVVGQNSAFSRLAGGIGGRGPGETKLETDRRRLRDRIAQLERQVDDLGRQRGERRKRRGKHSLPIVSLVGYTNAGKSTLLNTLTQSSVHAERRMFATLDPTSRRLRLPVDSEVIINDTVGFIRDLPQPLVAAFRATLEEISSSDVLVHVVDASNPRALQQIASVDKILSELGHGRVPMVVALNKADLVDRDEMAALERQVLLDKNLAAVPVSAIDPRSLVPLLEEVGTLLSGGLALEAGGARV